MKKNFMKAAAALLIAVLALGALTTCNRGTQGGRGQSTAFTGELRPFDINAASEITITMLARFDTNARKPTEDVLQPIWREKTKVIPTIVENQALESFEEYIQMHHLGGTLPMVLAPTNGLFGNHDLLMEELGVLREITLDMILTFMPKTVERLRSLGVTPEEWYNANLNPMNGKLMYVPGAPRRPTTNLVKEPEVLRDIAFNGGYSWIFRDDILKRIFPNAKTEAELKQVYIRNGGFLTWEDINDVPIRNFNDFHAYLARVRELNILVDGEPITPAQIQLNNDVGSLMWSAFSLSGIFWADLASRVYDFDRNTFVYFAETQRWKDYISFMNRCYNDRLIHPETFIMPDDQKDAKVANGEFAVWQFWMGSDGARQRAREKGESYGFRHIYLFPVDSFRTEIQDFTNSYQQMKEPWNAIGITYMAKDEDIPQILNWIDWNYSREAAELRAWGLPEWSMGEGRNRRFKPEYQELEAWALTGEGGPNRRDGIYYGLCRFDNLFTNWYAETYSVGWTFDDFYSPANVYPSVETDLDMINIGWEIEKASRMHYAAMQTFYAETSMAQDVVNARAAFDAHYAEEYEPNSLIFSLDSEGGKLATVAAIMGSTADFERNWNVFLDRYCRPADWQNVINRQKELYFNWLRLYRQHVAPINF